MNDDGEFCDLFESQTHVLSRRMMHHPDDMCLIAVQGLLHHRFDIDAKIAEDAGYRREHLGAIQNLHADVVTRLHLIYGYDRFLFETGVGDAPGRASTQVPANIDDVPHHRASRGAASGTSSVEHHVADTISFDKYRVVDIVGRG